MPIHFSWAFYMSYFDFLSFLFCLVWSYISYLHYSSCIYVSYLALRFACGFLRPSSRDLVLPGGLRSGSPLVVLVYRMAYLLVRVEFYPN